MSSTKPKETAATYHDSPVLDGGFELEIFVDASVREADICFVCRKVFRKPCQRQCGHSFCEVCLLSLKKKAAESPKVVVSCPVCIIHEEHGEESVITDDDLVSQDFAKTRYLDKKAVKCPFKNCDFSGSLRDYEKTHEFTCEYALVSCPQNCGQTIHITLIKDHVTNRCPRRRIECPYCGQEYFFNEMEAHDASCPTKPSTCQLCNKKCSTSEEFFKHMLDDCPYMVCALGCNEQFEREKIADHYVDLHYAKDHMLHIGRALSEMSINIKKMTSKLQVEVAASSDFNVDAAMSRIDEIEDQAKLLDNILSVYKVEFEKIYDASVVSDERRRLFETVLRGLSSRFRLLETAIQIRDAQIQERDLRIRALENVSYDGTLLWRVDNFPELRRKAQSGELTSIYSTPFYTGRCGYKMCARLYLNGDGAGKNTHVSFFFVVMRGKYDGLLRWPFQQRVTMMLLDYDGQNHVTSAFRPDVGSESFRRPKTDMNVATGCPVFMPLTTLQEKFKMYVRDDIAYFKVVVDCGDIAY